MANAGNIGKAGKLPFMPHIHSGLSVGMIMWITVFALLPAAGAGVYFFGVRALQVIGAGVLTAVLTELLMNLMMMKKPTVLDGSAVMTGLLFALMMPPAVPWHVLVTGCFFSVAIVKWAFGGLGYNFMNPALAGRIFVMAAWPAAMIGHWSPTVRGLVSGGTSFLDASAKITGLDALTTATPLSSMKAGGWDAVRNLGFDNYWNLFVGNVPGSIGETSALALLIGGILLMTMRIISWQVPLITIGTAALFSWIFGGLPYGGGWFAGNPLFHAMSGGLILGAFFMATDPVTSPITMRGKVIFAVLIGILAMTIRIWGGYPEGVGFAIVFMNIFVPLIDRYTRSRIFGRNEKKSAPLGGDGNG